MEKLPGVNGRVLAWARKRSGRSEHDVADLLNKEPGVVKAWELGTDHPTYAQLEKLAKMYRRPMALFFFPEPPEELDPVPEFRLVPGLEQDQFAPDTRFAIRLMAARRVSLRELTGNKNPCETLLTHQVSLNPASDMQAVCAQVRSLLGITLDTQFTWRNARHAFGHWREALEQAGIFVFKRPFKQKGLNGFCLNDPVFPLICINNSTAHSRQIFTLFHELGHLLCAADGITKTDETYVAQLPSEARALEVLCNRFAAQFLVPPQALDPILSQFEYSDVLVQNIARHFSVSREVILRRLLDLGLVDLETYSLKTNQWNQEWHERAKGGGGNYHATQATYLGRPFVKLGFDALYQGRSTREDLYEYFGVKVKHLDELEHRLLVG